MGRRKSSDATLILLAAARVGREAEAGLHRELNLAMRRNMPRYCALRPRCLRDFPEDARRNQPWNTA